MAAALHLAVTTIRPAAGHQQVINKFGYEERGEALTVYETRSN